MPQVSFVNHDGSMISVEGDEGDSVMYVATSNDIAGIDADCGGFCNCATCHVYIDPASQEKLPPMSEQEDELLDGTAADRLPTSRLSCQIILTAALDGLIVKTPARQK